MTKFAVQIEALDLTLVEESSPTGFARGGAGGWVVVTVTDEEELPAAAAAAFKVKRSSLRDEIADPDLSLIECRIAEVQRLGWFSRYRGTNVVLWVGTDEAVPNPAPN